MSTTALPTSSSLPAGTEWVLHACVLLAVTPPARRLPASKVAEFYDLPPAYMAKHLQALAAAGIVDSSTGRHGGFRLAQPADRITVLDIVDAIAGESLFECAEIRQRGPCAGEPNLYERRCGISAVMARAEQAWRDALAATTLAQLATSMARTTPVDVRTEARTWIEEAAR